MTEIQPTAPLALLRLIAKQPPTAPIGPGGRAKIRECLPALLDSWEREWDRVEKGLDRLIADINAADDRGEMSMSELTEHAPVELIEYELTNGEFDTLMDACAPTPVLYGPGGTPLVASAIENATRAWQRLGEKRGFDYLTVTPAPGRGQRFFLAKPTVKAPESPFVYVIFDGPPSHDAGRFVEVETENGHGLGRSIGIDWEEKPCATHQHPFWRLGPFLPPSALDELREKIILLGYCLYGQRGDIVRTYTEVQQALDRLTPA